MPSKPDVPDEAIKAGQDAHVEGRGPAEVVEAAVRKQERERLATGVVEESLDGLAEVADALEKALGGSQFEHDVRVVYVRMLALELPATIGAVRKQERQRVREALEAAVLLRGEYESCPHCGGSGKPMTTDLGNMGGEACSFCEGSGIRPRRLTLAEMRSVLDTLEKD